MLPLFPPATVCRLMHERSAAMDGIGTRLAGSPARPWPPLLAPGPWALRRNAAGADDKLNLCVAQWHDKHSRLVARPKVHGLCGHSPTRRHCLRLLGSLYISARAAILCIAVRDAAAGVARTSTAPVTPTSCLRTRLGGKLAMTAHWLGERRASSGSNVIIGAYCHVKAKGKCLPLKFSSHTNCSTLITTSPSLSPLPTPTNCSLKSTPLGTKPYAQTTNTTILYVHCEPLVSDILEFV